MRGEPIIRATTDRMSKAMFEFSSLDADKLMRLFGLLALLLYLAPLAFRRGLSARTQSWLQRGAIALLAVGVAIALFETARWFSRA